MKKLMSKFHFRSIYKTIVLTLILCFLYNIAYLFMSASDMNVYVRQSLEVGLSLLSSLGLYFICTKIWKKKNFSFQAIFKVLLLQAIYILIVSGILTNLVNICTKNMGLMLVLQLMSAFCLVVMVPFQLIFYYGLIHDKNLKEFIPMAIKKHQKSMYQNKLNRKQHSSQMIQFQINVRSQKQLFVLMRVVVVAMPAIQVKAIRVKKN